jgi:hypothetical protein
MDHTLRNVSEIVLNRINLSLTAAAREVRARRHTGELTEISNQMGLIGITEVGRDLPPVHGGSVVEAS